MTRQSIRKTAHQNGLFLTNQNSANMEMQQVLEAFKANEKFENATLTETGVKFTVKKDQKCYTVNFELKRGFYLSVGKFRLPFETLEDIVDFVLIY